MNEDDDVKVFLAPILSKIADYSHREKALSLIQHILIEYPELKLRIAWNQPMFTRNSTFILGISFAKAHMSISPEQQGILHFADELKEREIDFSKMLIRFPWKDEVPLDLIHDIIDFNIADKASLTTFWRHS